MSGRRGGRGGGGGEGERERERERERGVGEGEVSVCEGPCEENKWIMHRHENKRPSVTGRMGREESEYL